MTSAQVIRPYGIAFDKTGNLYIADVVYGAIRKVTPDGIIRTFFSDAQPKHSERFGSRLSGNPVHCQSMEQSSRQGFFSGNRHHGSRRRDAGQRADSDRRTSREVTYPFSFKSERQPVRMS